MRNLSNSQTHLARYKINYLRLAWLTIFFLFLPVFFMVSGSINIRQDPFLILPFVIVPAGISIYRAYLLIMNYDLEILVHNDGFSYSNAGETRRYYWREIEKVWATKYELMSLIYIKYIKVKILDTSGKTLTLDRTLKDVEKFEALVQEQIAREKFPQAISILQQGGNLEFGGLTVTNSYIKSEHDLIRWGELGDIQTWQGTLRLWKKGKKAISIMTGVPLIPNYVLLISLIQYLSENAQRSSIPSQDLADEMYLVEEAALSVKSKPGIRIRPGGNTDARLTGLFVLLLGVGAGYWDIFLPIKKAVQQEPYISYSSEVVIIAAIAVFMGLFLLFFGADGLGSLSKPSSRIGSILFIISMILFILVCYFGMQFIMKGLGYY